MRDTTFVIPYRDRQSHLDTFIPHLTRYLQNADFTWQIVVVEQDAGKPFNRGKLLNIGFIESESNYFVFHDVDMLPVTVDYSPCFGVKQLAGNRVQRVDFLGGVTMFQSATFYQCGGYHNDYFCRAEDNEMRFHLRRCKIPVHEKHGHFRTMNHARPLVEFDKALWEKAKQPRIQTNQLMICNYAILSDKKEHGYRRLLVSI